MAQLMTRLSSNDRKSRSPSVSCPKIVGHFSIDKNRQFIPNFTQCTYLKLPECTGESFHLDLNEGYEISIPKPTSAHAEKLDQMLHFLHDNMDQFKNNSNAKKLLKPDIICFRGLLKLLMTTPCKLNDPWTILATNYKGNIYLLRMETEADIKKVQRQSEEQKKICSYGFKFEQYLLTDDPAIAPITNKPVNESEEFCCVYQTVLDDLSILYGAEMDGMISKEKLDLSTIDWNMMEFIELKVMRKNLSKWQQVNFARFRLRDWWCQCFLVGIKKIIVGERSDAGIVENIKTMMVDDIPSMTQKHWTPGVCLQFCSDFLHMVKDLMANIDSSKTVFKFDWDPADGNVKLTKFNESDDLRFVSDWYVNGLK